MGLSSGIFAAVALLSQAYLGSSIKLLILGSVVETARRVCQWLIERFRIQYSVTAKFDEGDPAYEWILLFLTQENVWRRSRKFTVTATNSRRKWAVNKWMDPTVKGSAEYVPSYQKPQLFRWRGHWIDIQRSNDSGPASFMPTGVYMQTATIYLTIYTLDMNVLSELVEEAHGRYVEINRPNVVIHLADSLHFGAGMTWNNVKHKVHRPLSSIILQEGVVDALVRDAQEFISTEDWYVEAGIPHRRGYLLYGPPGTGKTSTIYALAGALNLEIYSLSLASGCVDDSSLQRVASAIPKHALFLIEDIDCAFARDDEDDDECGVFGMATQVRADGMMKPVGSKVTLSGLLNVIDGVGSEEGKIFFATTNYIDRLDPALLRPGRIDRKVAYRLATEEQACALFLRFFPPERFPNVLDESSGAAENVGAAGKDIMLPECQAILVPVTREKTPASASISTPGAPDTIVLPTARGTITALAARFASHIPTGEFSTAELQCYLQGYKIHPAEAVMDAAAWVAEQRAERKAREAREVERKQRARERRGQMLAAGVGMQTLGVPMPMKAMPMQMQTIPMQSQPTPMQILGAGEGEDTRLVVDHARAREEGKWSLTQGSASGSEVSSYINGALPAESAMDLEAPASVR